MTHTIETLKELHEQRFMALDRAIALAAEEMARRLEVLNHYHELAREKERDFIRREAFETFVQRVADDLALSKHGRYDRRDRGDGKRGAAFFPWKRVENYRLLARLQAAAEEALRESKNDELRKTACQPAKGRTYSEHC